MDKYEFQAKVDTAMSKIARFIPRLFQALFNTLSFLMYTITLLWVLLTSIMTLGLLYIGSAASYIQDKIATWRNKL